MRFQIMAILVAFLPTALAAEPPDTRVLMLSGQGNDDGVPWQFHCSAGNKSGTWTTIPVPSNWECQGFGSFTYGRGKEEKVRIQGQYRRSFTVPQEWQGQAIRLVFEGVHTDTRARINGQSVGDMHQGGFYRFAYDVTALVKPGAENRIEVDVDNFSANATVNGAERSGDYWNFSGIFRPVYLECDPPRYVERIAIDAKADGSFSVQVFGGGNGAVDQVEARIQDLAGHPVGAPFSAPFVANGATRLTTTVAQPRLWSSENPELYQVDVRLLRGGQVLHRKLQRFGFRTVELRVGDGIYINGKRIILQGTCRHSFWPDSGRCTSATLSRKDITLMKEMNANAVRMSHYPPDQHFLDLCDELGLYVLDELAGWHQAYATPIGQKLVREMVTRDVNHPAVIFWDNGNEGGWNTELDDEFAKWDPQQRLVVHPREALFRGLNTLHYGSFDMQKERAESGAVFMPTEFLHGLFDGGAGAGMEDTWPILRGPHCAGGFVWTWVDECVKRPDQGGKLDGHGNNAPDGILGPYREKEASYFTLKSIWSPVQIPLKSLPKDFSGALPVENRYAFTDLSRCRFTWELRALHRITSDAAGHTIVAKGDIPAPAVVPGASGTLRLTLPTDHGDADVLALSARDPQDRELWTWTWPLSRPAPVQTAASSGAVTIQEYPQHLTLSVGDLSVRIARATGQLAEVRRGSSVFPLSQGPRPLAGPVSAKNDKQSAAPVIGATLTGLTHRSEGGAQVVEAAFSGALVKTCWRLTGDGWLHLDYTYRYNGAVSYLGVGFDLPEKSVSNMRWCGQGPYRVWKNRLLGGSLDVWELAVNDTSTGLNGWLYPETGGYYADVRWMTLRTSAGPITIRLDDGPRFVQVFSSHLPDTDLALKAVADYPTTGISLLDSIAPMGNKFTMPYSTGPQSLPTNAAGDYHGSVSFWFGPGIR